MTRWTVQATDKNGMTVEQQGAPTTLARVKRSYLMRAPMGHATASNDSLFERQSEARRTLSAWARHAGAANGFGGQTPEETQKEAPQATVPANALQLALAARAARADVFWRVVFQGGHLAAQAVRRILAAWRRQRDEHATYRALSGLDQHTLRDIGFDRSEARSVAAELAGRADPTRARALMTLRSLSV
jgi:uncharacterized protein YjiS (DUF1127 family)